MPQTIDFKQHVMLSHRENFFGKPTGPSTVSWQYKGKPHLIKRPDDGHPPKQWRVKCDECGKQLEFNVYSVQDAKRRQARRRAVAWTGLVLLIVSLIGIFVIGGAAVPFLIGTAIIGAALGYYIGSMAAGEMGISGHGAGQLIVAKHAVGLIESRPADRPELTCDKCGHHEEYPWQSHYRKGFADKQYEAARQRLAAHTCRPKQSEPAG
jgi:DNA-directed RNA polymerase subunit M/transcription elongation factor TFIIS